MNRIVLIAALFLSSLTSFSQGNRSFSRLFGQNAVMKHVMPNNFLYVDMADPERRVYPAGISAIRLKTTNITGLADSINAAIARSGMSSNIVSWNSIIDKPVMPVMPSAVSAFTNDAGYLKSVPAQSWSSITGKPNMSAVATSGSYQDLADKPAIPASQVQSDWNAVSGMGVILNKPVMPQIPANVSAFNNDAGYLTQVPTVTWNSISGTPSFSAVAISGNYNDLMNKPTPVPAQVNVDWSASSGITQILNKPIIPTALSSLLNDVGYITQIPAQSYASLTGKPAFATVATTGSYSDLINKPAIPVIKRVETYSGTTNASGVYSVTFATPYAVAPNIQASITNQSNQQQQIRVVSVTTTGFTVNVYQRNVATLLGIEVLIATMSNVASQSVDILVTEK